MMFRDWWRKRSEADFREEIEAHIALQADQLQAQRGLPANEARDAARRAFGNVGAAQERFYEAGRWAWLDRTGQHLRYAARALKQRPAFTAAIVLTLAIGIAFNTIIFTYLYALMLRPLPLRDASDLVNVYQVFRSGNGRMVNGMASLVSYREYLNYRAGMESLPAETRAIDTPVVYRQVELSFEEAQRKSTKAEYVSCNFFGTLRIRLALGRGFSADECRAAGSSPVAVVSHETWTRELGGSPAVLGRSITLNRVVFTVIGVAEPGFSGLQVERSHLWIPVTMQPVIDHGRDSVLMADASWLLMIARLTSGHAAEDARKQLAVQAHRMDAEHPGRETRVVVPAAAFLNFPEVREKGGVAVAMFVVLGGLVIAMICANIMNLLLARGLARRREIAIRLAIGASRGRLIEQLLTESLVLSFIGGALALALTYTLPFIAAALVPVGLVQLQVQLSPDRQVLMFTLGVSMITAVIFGFVPALQATDVDLASASKDGISSSAKRRLRPSRIRSAVVGVQVAGSALLLILAALFTRAALKGSSIDPGYATRGVVSFQLNLEQLDYRGLRAWRVYTQLRDRLAATPGVEDAALVSRMPLLGRQSEGVEPVDPRVPADAPRNIRTYSLTDVSGRFFSTMQIAFAAGRAFTDDDIVNGIAGLPPAVISEALAKAFWPVLTPREVVGQRVRCGRQEYVITGIARNVRYLSFADPATPFLYRGVRPTVTTDLRLIARVRGSMSLIERELPRWAEQLDPAVVAESERFTQRVEMELLPARLSSQIAGAMGVLALTLAIVGIYGVVDYAVSQRGREIGIRLALGATRVGVVGLMMRQSARPVVVGLAAGTAASVGVSFIVRQLLLGISPLDPLAYIGMLAILACAAAAASFVPSRRAAGIDPARTLRED
jgi:predicted permease